MSYEHLFQLISELVLCHSPSGSEQEIDRLICAKLAEIGVRHWQDASGNIVAKIDGSDSSKALAITAHKDEIGGIVKKIGPDGKIQVRKLGGAFPWVYGEGVVDLLGDKGVVHGVLSFGSRHVSHESPQKVHQDNRALLWEDVWVQTKHGKQFLEAAGIRPGTRMVVGKHRKKPFRLGDYIASYALDNKASLAILLTLAQMLNSPASDVYLVASAKEEVGAIGAQYFTRTQKLDTLIALEICPISPEYAVASDEDPVLLSQDGYGLYDEALNGRLLDAARALGIDVQFAVLSQFGSDASIAMKAGQVPQAACLGFPAENTHGYEIAHLGAVEKCIRVLQKFCRPEDTTQGP